MVNGVEFSSRGSEVSLWGHRKGVSEKERDCRLLLMYIHLDELDFFRDGDSVKEEKECDDCDDGESGVCDD